MTCNKADMSGDITRDCIERVMRQLSDNSLILMRRPQSTGIY
jgi:hypothetical protein